MSQNIPKKKSMSVPKGASSSKESRESTLRSTKGPEKGSNKSNSLSKRKVSTIIEEKGKINVIMCIGK